MVTGAEIAAIAAGAATAIAYYGLITAMAHLVAATTLGAAAIALGHGIHSGVSLARGCKKIAELELRALVRVNYTHGGTFVIRKAENHGTLKIYKVETESLIFHKTNATSHTWRMDGNFDKVSCKYSRSGFVTRVRSSGLISGDIENTSLRMEVGDFIMLMAAALPSTWTGLVAELNDEGLLETQCDDHMVHSMLTGRMTLRYFDALKPLMTEFVDVA